MNILKYKIPIIPVIIIIISVLSVSLLFPNAFAAQEESIPSVVDGIKTTHLIAGVAITGIILQTYKGMIGKKKSEFSIDQLAFTVIVGIISSIFILGPAFQAISKDISDPDLMIFLMQQVLTVIGAKTVFDTGKKHFNNSKSNVDKNIDDTLPPPLIEDDIPPGKDEDLGNISSVTKEGIK